MGGQEATRFTSIDRYTLTIRTPPHVPGIYNVIARTRYGTSQPTSGSKFTFNTHTLFSGHGCCDNYDHYFTAPQSGIPWTVAYSYACPLYDSATETNYTIDLSIGFNISGQSVDSELATGVAGPPATGP